MLIGNKLKNLNLYSIAAENSFVSKGYDKNNLENILKDIYETNTATNTKDQVIYDTIFIIYRTIKRKAYNNMHA